MEEKISSAVIRRLPRYYRYLQDLESKGIDKISSSQMSKELGHNASQIRRDLSHFGGFGQQGYGYSVATLKRAIAKILGLNTPHSAIVVGAGRIGQALIGYRSFSDEGFNITAGFDNDPAKVGVQPNGQRVYPLEDLKNYLTAHPTEIGIICTPKEYAQQTADTLVSHGIKAIWNFSPGDIDVRRGVSVENVRLSDSLYVLSYHMNIQNEKDGL